MPCARYLIPERCSSGSNAHSECVSIEARPPTIWPSIWGWAWIERQHRDELVKAGAVMILRGKKLVDPAVCDEIVMGSARPHKSRRCTDPGKQRAPRRQDEARRARHQRVTGAHRSGTGRAEGSSRRPPFKASGVGGAGTRDCTIGKRASHDGGGATAGCERTRGGHRSPHLHPE